MDIHVIIRVPIYVPLHTYWDGPWYYPIIISLCLAARVRVIDRTFHGSLSRTCTGPTSKSVRLYPSISISTRCVSLYKEVELDPSFSHHCTRCIGGPPIRIIIYNLRYVRIYLRIYPLAYDHEPSGYVWSSTWNGTCIITCILVRHRSSLVPCEDTLTGYGTTSLMIVVFIWEYSSRHLALTLLWRGPHHCI